MALAPPSSVVHWVSYGASSGPHSDRGITLHVYRINAVGNDGRPLVLGTVDTATQALTKIRDALGDYPRAWVTNEEDLDVTWADLMRLSEAEQAR